MFNSIKTIFFFIVQLLVTLYILRVLYALNSSIFKEQPMIIIGFILSSAALYLCYKKLWSDRWWIAHNALLAKYTYERLDQNKQNEVRVTAAEMLRSGSPFDNAENLPDEYYLADIDAFDRRLKYGMYAGAMMLLGIQPYVEDTYWKYMNKRIYHLRVSQKMLEIVSHAYKRKYKVDLTL